MRGEALSCAIIDKLPFALKQGAGRLIRDARDRGVLVVCDPRLLSRSYGHAFLASLPPMFRSRDLRDVQHFFAADAESPS